MTTLAALLPLIHLLVSAPPAPPVTFESLLNEMIDRTAVARWPDPEYTCRQFSSYDRASTSPDNPDTWFANGDSNHFLRVEDVPARKGVPAHQEWVMADTDGPGAIVRIWSPDPKGTLRIYIDNATTPALEAPMADLLSGKVAGIPEPIAQSKSRGWNCYLPIPYAKHCKVTSDHDGFYYQINYRNYAAGAEVEPFSSNQLVQYSATIKHVSSALAESTDPEKLATESNPWQRLITIATGENHAIKLVSPTRDPADTGRAITGLIVASQNLTNDGIEPYGVLRNVVLSMSFDSEPTVWCPIGDFFSYPGGVLDESCDWYRKFERRRSLGHGLEVLPVLACQWVMPFRENAEITITNFGKQTVSLAVEYRVKPLPWTDHSMHFHAGWRQQHPIHTKKAAGTMDWNFVEISGGKGVYVGDNLSIVNPVADWWGEGDEKIYVDGEKFPSHFGTGTEDYYGYGWCCPDTFLAPFQSQVRCDGGKLDPKNNWGHTSLTRIRSLDAIPFKHALKFDMEVWHWAECDMAYAATTYWYAMPGVTSNRGESIDEVKRGIIEPKPLPPPPPPFKIAGAIECEDMFILKQNTKNEPPAAVGTPAAEQNMRGFRNGDKAWSNDAHLWVQARNIGYSIDLRVPAPKPGPQRLMLYATKSWDYGIIRVTVNDHPTACGDLDLCSGKQGLCEPTGPIDLGLHTPTTDPDGPHFAVRFELLGKSAKAAPPGTFFGLDCIVVSDTK